MLIRKIPGFCYSINRLAATRQCHSIKGKQIIIKSDFFDNHPIDSKSIAELEGINSIRKNRGSIEIVRDLFRKYEGETNEEKKSEIKSKLRNEFKKFPNKTHPTVLGYGRNAGNVELYSYGDLHNNTNPDLKSYEWLCEHSKTLRMNELGCFTGTRSYYFMHSIAEIEQALIRYTTDFLFKEGFELISVPDILPADVIEGCGMPPVAENSQVYRLSPSQLCLSGTSEMALAGYFSEKTMKKKELPKKVMAVSRCFRAEADEHAQGMNLYRVHCFTKVEMFAVCLPTESDKMLEQFRSIECRLFESLGLCFKLYDMPIHELGAPAYRKYDIEAWMPSRKAFGEISSTSNCTDYQSKRLNIYVEDGSEKYYAHTVNGTACAIPRMIIALLEQKQTPRSVRVPEALQPYMGGMKELVSTKLVPALRLTNRIKE